jgi:glutathione S-transferase
VFILHTTLLSANGRKVVALCRQLGLDPEIHEVNVYRGEGQAPAYRAINPSGRIPTLVEGGFVLTESNAILGYVADVHGGARLFSRDPRERARISSWLFWESAHWQPALIEVLTPYVGHRLLPDAISAPVGPPDWEHAKLRPLLDRLEAELSERPYLVGEALSLADFSVGGMTTYFRAVDFPFDAFPKLAAWCQRLDALPAWGARGRRSS